jgi:hypothetical protein
VFGPYCSLAEELDATGNARTASPGKEGASASLSCGDRDDLRKCSIAEDDSMVRYRALGTSRADRSEIAAFEDSTEASGQAGPTPVLSTAAFDTRSTICALTWKAA